MKSQSDCKSRGGGDARRHDGVDDDDFFEPELFHEASPRAGSNLLVRSRRMPGRLSSTRCFLESRGEAEFSDQPRVLTYLETVFNQRYGKDAVGLRTSREMRTIAESIDALVLRAGDLLIQRFKALETSVVDGTWSRADITSLFQRKASGLPLLQSVRPFRGWSASGGVSRRRSSWAKFGGAPRESTSRGPEKYSARGARGHLEKAKIGCSHREAKGAAAGRRRSTASLVSAESGVGGEEAEKTQARRVLLKPGPSERPWKKKLASVAPRLP